VVLILSEELGIVFEAMRRGVSSHLVTQVIGFRISLPYSEAVVVSNGKELAALKLIALLSRCPASPTLYAMSPRSGCHVMQLGCGVQWMRQASTLPEPHLRLTEAAQPVEQSAMIASPLFITITPS
jgi:hypothetical protein